MKKISNYLYGLVLIIIGVLLGLNALKITNINIFFKGWWTLFIIVPCFIDLFNDKNKTGNIIGIIIGLLLLLMCQGILDLSLVYKLIVPIILVILGLSLIFKDSLKKDIKKKINNLNTKNMQEYSATFSSQNLNFANQKFNGCELNSVFGSIKCNLLDSDIKNETLIKATAIFGGIDIIIPSSVSVKVISTSIFGGVSNKHESLEESNTKVLYIEATCLFGGVDIK